MTNGIESAIRMSGQTRVAHDRETIGAVAIQKSRNLETPKGKPMTDKIDSADDARTENSTMRHQYRVLTDAEKAQMAEIKDIGQTFLDVCDTIGTSRELAIAKTKMEEAVMWAVKHVTR